MMWKMQQAMEDDAIRTTKIHPIFIPVTRLKCSYLLATLNIWDTLF